MQKIPKSPVLHCSHSQKAYQPPLGLGRPLLTQGSQARCSTGLQAGSTGILTTRAERCWLPADERGWEHLTSPCFSRLGGPVFAEVTGNYHCIRMKGELWAVSNRSQFRENKPSPEVVCPGVNLRKLTGASTMHTWKR